MKYNQIDNEGIINFACRNYDNPGCVSIEEFKTDFNRIIHIDKLFHRYYEKNDLKIRLLLNHIIIMYNVFVPSACTELLFYKLKPEYRSGLKTILTYLNFMPETVVSINTFDADIPIDETIAKELRKI